MPVSVAEAASVLPLPPIDRDFAVAEVVDVEFSSGRFHCRYRRLASPYAKSYPEPAVPPEGAALLIARIGGGLAGSLLLSPSWTGFADIADIAVNRSARHQGVARALIDEAKRWAVGRRLLGLRAETQNTNAPACRLYSACGFQLGGIDAMLYLGSPPVAGEQALFWYWRPQAGT